MKKQIVITIIGMFLVVTIAQGFYDNIEKMNSVGNLNLSGFENWTYDNETGGWLIIFYARLINKSIDWTANITNSPRAVVKFTHMYQFESYSYYDEESEHLYSYQAQGYLELSSDNGTTWKIVDMFNGNSDGITDETYDVSSYEGSKLMLRIRVEGRGDTYFMDNPGGYWLFWDFSLDGMGDTLSPTTKMGILFNQQSSNSVTFHLYGFDNESGVREVHFIHNGVESVGTDNVYYTAEVRGVHSVTWWSVDLAGNEEIHHSIPGFRVDLTPPKITSVRPEPGFYLFGNKILNLNKNIFIVGAFFIEADASDDDSGIYNVSFYLNNELIAQDTEAPYSAYCAVKHQGLATIKVVAADFGGNTDEATLDVIYYKFL